MKLKSLLSGVNVKQSINFKNVDILNLYNDDKKVETGGLYFCLKGKTFDGHDYAESAINKGAVALVVENEIENVTVPQIVVEDCRIAMSQISKTFFGSACDKIKVVSLVGTNGKTTTSYIINEILKTQGIKSAIIGTNGVVVNGKTISQGLTTPDPIELHYIFKQLLQLKVKVAIMEVSAQAIYFSKVYGVFSDVAVFTNLSNEHLDFFNSMEEYEKVKVGFFKPDNVGVAVVNVDDNAGLKILNNSNVKCLTYGLSNPSDTFAIDITTSFKGTDFIINALDNIFEVKTKLMGIYNVYNIMASVNVVLELGCEVDNIIFALKKLKEVPGRMNLFNLDCNNKVIVDYAHTPDGFENVLSLIRKLRQGRIITVFGCVGYSDSAKRAQMGHIASKYSNVVILTADNPNFAPLSEINRDVKQLMKQNVECIEIENRAEAIENGFSLLDKNDTLVILGKGVENYNKINGVNVVHNDIECVNSCIEKWYGLKRVNNEVV